MAYTTKNSTGYGTLTYTGSDYGFVHQGGLWTDMVQGAAGLNPAGSAAPPTIDTADGFLKFAGASADNILSGQWQLEHGWVSGTNVSPHMHILSAAATDPTAPNDVARFGLSYKLYAATGSEEAAGFTALTNVDINLTPHGDNARPVMQIVSLGTIDMTGYRDSAIVAWKLTRYASNTSVDVYPDVVRLVSIDLHYKKGHFGSINIGGEDF